jgi:hypothetical protein
MKLSPEKMDEYLESRLLEWGEWLHTGNFLGIGYPSQAIVQLIQEGKIVAREEKFRAVLEVNENADPIQAIAPPSLIKVFIIAVPITPKFAAWGIISSRISSWCMTFKYCTEAERTKPVLP